MPDKLLNGDATGSNSSDDKAMITKNTDLFGLRFLQFYTDLFILCQKLFINLNAANCLIKSNAMPCLFMNIIKVDIVVIVYTT